MSVTALKGAFGFGPQAAKSLAASGNFKWFKSNNVDAAIVIDDRPIPQEIGGGLFPTGSYRAGAYFAGGWDMAPRLESNLGWLLCWMLGVDAVTTPNDPVAGVYKHTWTITGDEDVLDWGTIHEILPGTTQIGAVALDCMVSGGRFVLPQAGLLMARTDAQGRLADQPTDAVFAAVTGADWTPSYEVYTTIPTSGTTGGGMVVSGLNDGNRIPATNLTLDIVNGLTTPAQEMIIGSLYPDDFTSIARTITASVVYKWKDPALYRKILTGDVSGTVLEDSPFEGQAVIRYKAPTFITGTTSYEMVVTLPNVQWQIEHPRLAGANLVQVNLVGTALDLPGENVAVIDLYNADNAGFVWPA